MTLLALATGIILGVGWCWLWLERRRLEGRLQAVLDENNRLFTDMMERLEALDQRSYGAMAGLAVGERTGERERIATRLRADPKYRGMDDDRLEAAVNQIMQASRVKVKPL